MFRLWLSYLRSGKYIIFIPLFFFSSQAFSINTHMSYDSIYKLGISDKETSEKAVSISEEYEAQIAPLQKRQILVDMSTEDLVLIYQSANIANFYTQSARYLNDMELDVSVLKSRGKDTDAYYIDLYGAYLSTRNFDGARALINSHKTLDLAPPPTIAGRLTDSNFSELRVDATGNSLRQNSVSLEGAKIIVIAHPLCHFSRNASAYIESNSNLAKIFSKNSTWLVPPSRAMDFELVAAWNKAHPGEQMSFAIARHQWPMLKSWETPTFYFFKNGQLVSTVTGWPKEGNAPALRRSLEKIGLM